MSLKSPACSSFLLTTLMHAVGLDPGRNLLGPDRHLPPGAASSEVHSLEGAPSEASEGLMESVSGSDATTTPAEPDNRELLAMMSAMQKQLAAQKEETKRQLDEQQKKHAEEIATLKSTQQKLKPVSYTHLTLPTILLV